MLDYGKMTGKTSKRFVFIYPIVVFVFNLFSTISNELVNSALEPITNILPHNKMAYKYSKNDILNLLIKIKPLKIHIL